MHETNPIERPQRRITKGDVVRGVLVTGFYAFLVHSGYDGAMNMLPHLSDAVSASTTVVEHLKEMIPFAIGRVMDLTSTSFAMKAAVASGTPKEEVYKQELSPIMRRPIRLWYQGHKVLSALTSTGIETSVWSAAFLNPSDWSFYLPVGIFLAINNSLAGILAYRNGRRQNSSIEDELDL